MIFRYIKIVMVLVLFSSCEHFLFTSRLRNNFYQKKYSEKLNDKNVSIFISSGFDSTDYIQIFDTDSILFKGKCNGSYCYACANIRYQTNRKELNLSVLLNDSLEAKFFKKIAEKPLKICITKEGNKVYFEER